MAQNPEPDEVLAERARLGDRLAHDELCDRYLGQLSRLASRICGDCDLGSGVADDVLADLLRRLARYDPKLKFSSWLYAVTVNAARDVQRSRRRGGLVVSLDDLLGELSENALDPLERACANDQQRAAATALMRLRGWITSLPTAQRDAMRAMFDHVLRVGSAPDSAELARSLGKRPGTVRANLKRGRDALLRRIPASLLPWNREPTDEKSDSEESDS
ncbi:MAG: RNA polymerase sigma factor [Planctomycetes bacterium]|nr:RNA polymerase sigma factor [Planctomycetota bacterium]